MAWKAEIIDKQFKNTKLSVTIRFTEGTKVVEKVFTDTVGQVDIPREAREFVKSLNKLSDLNSDIALGQVDLTEPPVVAAPKTVPTREQLDTSNFLEKLIELRRKKEYVELGLMEDSALDVLRGEITSLGSKIGVF